VVTEAEGLIGTLLTQRYQKLEVDVSEELPHVEGDEVRLTQVFVNLIANANKYAPDYSTIRVGAHLYGNEVFAWVEDEGPGIADSSFHSIFERFTRGVSHEPEAGGLGLGLWIVKSIVDRHGGTIRAERTAERRTRFVITLPLPTTKLPDKFIQA
jgi:signal transduction histidine kinase